MSDVPLIDILGVGVNVVVGAGEGVAVKGLAASVCFAKARAVLARDVSTAGGFTIGVGADRPQPLRIDRNKDPITMEYKRRSFIVSSK